jgi:2-polyprenyl-3-methyl-5-hydroxy-6-metoxy-1,4-benzoquinol methylase
VIDFGCGNGEFFSMLGYANINVVGIENQPSLHALAKSNADYIALHTALNEHVPVADTIICNSVLEHVPSLPETLQTLKQYLTPGGNFFFTVPALHWEEQLLGTILYGKVYGENMNNRFQHLNMYNEKKWEEVLVRAGFRLVQTQRYMSPIAYIFADMLLRYPAVAPFMMDDLYEIWRLDSELCRRDTSGGSLFVTAIST